MSKEKLPPPRFEDVRRLRTFEKVDEANALLLALEMALSDLEDSESKYALKLVCEVIGNKLREAIKLIDKGASA
ncbi:MAG: hypothetical protein JJU21_03055 [Salinarimonas sp.]|nr:hypothetical protein [Salinarimonas sp.]